MILSLLTVALLVWIPVASGQVIIRDEDGATRLPVRDGRMLDLVKQAAGEPPPRLVPEVAKKMVVGGHVRYVTLPDIFLDQFATVHPSLDSFSAGASVAWPMGEGHRLVVELDVTGVSFDDGNWLGKDTENPIDTRYVEMGLVLISADVTYRRHLWLHDRVAIMLGGGLGLAAVAGDIKNSEVLPDCADPATCPHWERAGQSEPSLPTPILPVLHLTTGVHVEIVSGLSARLEAGFKDVLYTGLSVGYTL